MHNADLYNQSNSLQKRDALACLEKYTSKRKWKKDSNRILDIGCGDGSVTNILQKYVPPNFTLLGVDISEDMVKYATVNYGNEQTSFTVLDIGGDIPEKMKNNFDIVFSCYTLHWIMDQKKVYKNIFDLLDQDGECYLIYLGYHSVFDVYRTLSQNEKWSTWVHNVESNISPYHDSEEPHKEIIKLMESIGFIDIDVECEDKVYLYDDIDIMKKHMTAINPFKIPEDKSEDFMQDYIQALKNIEMKYEGNSKNFAKGITVYYKLLTVYGCKCRYE